MRRWCEDEDGSLTLWMLGLALLLLAVGGISVDLWRAHAVRRDLAAVADAAAFAGASGVDTTLFRGTGAVLLDPPTAEALARRDLDRSGNPHGAQWTVTASSITVEVVAEGEVDLALLGLLAPGYDPLPVRVSARATPRLEP